MLSRSHPWHKKNVACWEKRAVTLQQAAQDPAMCHECRSHGSAVLLVTTSTCPSQSRAGWHWYLAESRLGAHQVDPACTAAHGDDVAGVMISPVARAQPPSLHGGSTIDDWFALKPAGYIAYRVDFTNPSHFYLPGIVLDFKDKTIEEISKTMSLRLRHNPRYTDSRSRGARLITDRGGIAPISQLWDCLSDLASPAVIVEMIRQNVPGRFQMFNLAKFDDAGNVVEIAHWLIGCVSFHSQR